MVSLAILVAEASAAFRPGCFTACLWPTQAQGWAAYSACTVPAIRVGCVPHHTTYREPWLETNLEPRNASKLTFCPQASVTVIASSSRGNEPGRKPLMLR